MRVDLVARDTAKRSTKDATGDIEHDQAGRTWFRYKQIRMHTLFLCQVCQYLFDSDSGFRETMARKASTAAGGGS